MIHFTAGGGTLGSEGDGVCGGIRIRRGSESSVFLSVFEWVLGTAVFLRVFERGFGNGLRGNWASEGVAK